MNVGKRKHFHAKGIKNIFNNTNLKKKKQKKIPKLTNQDAYLGTRKI